MIAEDAKRLAAQLDTVFEDVQMMWFDGSREPVVVPIARAAVARSSSEATHSAPNRIEVRYLQHSTATVNLRALAATSAGLRLSIEGAVS